MAWRATSRGVWKSGPMSTSNPRSAKPLAMTFAPRSWPSCPIFATRIRGRRPSATSNASTNRSVDWYSSSPLSRCWSVVPSWNDAAYTPCTMDVLGTCLPQAFSSARDISPRVHRALAHAMQRCSRLFGSSPLLVLSSASLALASSFARASIARSSSREALTSFMRAICFVRTSVLSIFRTSTRSSSSSLEVRRYLLTPTTTSTQESIRPCFFAALSSM
mmetsp:Transcript_24522/g.52219  ORF Transcript_24522/g.52219 Transcript_24522/m.52219 type:complete len:219 (-) Transcript_24522:984-1640(-)